MGITDSSKILGTSRSEVNSTGRIRRRGRDRIPAEGPRRGSRNGERGERGERLRAITEALDHPGTRGRGVYSHLSV